MILPTRYLVICPVRILVNQTTVAYLFFSPSFGLLIVNLQSDARKEFKGSIARRTPQA
jgi:hypothetical protein